MAYSFSSHRKLYKKALIHLPWLFLAQLPEGLLSFLQKYFETEWADSPKLSFLILYPLYCASSAVCSAATFAIIQMPSETSFSLRYLTKKLYPKMKYLILTSWLLGIVMIPAMLIIFPGIWILSQYLFLPFTVLTGPEKNFWFYFEASKNFSVSNRQVCLLTASLSFVVSLCSYLGLGILSQWAQSSGLLLGTEAILSMLLSLLLTTWTATLYQEVSSP